MHNVCMFSTADSWPKAPYQTTSQWLLVLLPYSSHAVLTVAKLIWEFFFMKMLASLTWHFLALSPPYTHIRSNLGFRVLLKDTSMCGQEERWDHQPFSWIQDWVELFFKCPPYLIKSYLCLKAFKLFIINYYVSFSNLFGHLMNNEYE